MRLLNSLRGGRRLLLLPLLTSVLVLGCSEEGAQPGESRFGRLQLESAGAPIEFPEVAVLRRWETFKKKRSDHTDWKVTGGTLSPWSLDGQPILKVDRSEGPVMISIPVDLELNPRLIVNMLTLVRGAETKLSVGLHAGKKKLAFEQLRIKGARDVRGQTFRLTETQDEHGKVNAIVIKVSQGKEPFAIRSITVRDAPLGIDLGTAAFGGFELVEIEGDARRATALPSGALLKSTVEVGGERDVLRFSFGQPDTTQVQGQDCELVVSLRGSGDASAEQSFSLQAKLGKQNEWQDAELSLAKFAGQSVEVSLELRSDEGAAICALGEPRYSARSSDAASVLLITSDTHRADHLGFLMEDGELRTDAIDKLAAEGLVFLDAVSSVNNTTPSHVSLMTGMSPRDTGLVANAKRLADEAPTLAEAFRDRGYATLAAVSASPVNYKFCNLGQGFDRYAIPAGKSVHDSSITLACMQDWLEDYEGSPVFAWVHIYDAHGPYDPPEDYKRIYYDEDKDPFDVAATGANKAMSPYWDKKIADPDYTENLYKGEITYMDEGLGKLFDLPRMQRGIIVLTSDHGEVLRYGPAEPFDHRGLSLNTIAVPLIFRAPGLAPGERRNDPVQQIDVGRTLLNLAGYPDEPFPGRDLIGTTLEVGEPRFAIQANGISASVLTDKWMLDMTLRVTGKEAEKRAATLHAIRLYDIVNDRFCRNNVWEENRPKAESLRRLLIRWLGRAENNGWQTDDVLGSKEIEQHLADLGYVTVEDSTESVWFDPECECDWCLKFAE